MAHFTAQQDRTRSIAGMLRGTIENWREAIARRRVYERTLHELSQLTDRELSDIGLGRSQISDVALDASRHI